jgi:hypothetical protein
MLRDGSAANLGLEPDFNANTLLNPLLEKISNLSKRNYSTIREGAYDFICKYFFSFLLLIHLLLNLFKECAYEKVF